MNKTKKFTSLAIVFVLLFCSVFSAFANEQASNTYTIGNQTIIFDAESNLTTEQQQNIANLLANPEYGVAKANLLCTLFGHKNTSETVVSITHKVSATAPRCMRETFIVTTCSRCDETSSRRTGYTYISCCPEE